MLGVAHVADADVAVDGAVDVSATVVVDLRRPRRRPGPHHNCA
jgi:hypothetical protein